MSERVMLAKEFVKLPKGETAYAQPKFDGIRAYGKADGVYSRNGSKFVTVPHIELALKDLFLQNPQTVLDGELYTHTLNDDFPKICSLVKKQYPTTQDLVDSSIIQFHICDMITLSDAVFGPRFDFLKQLLSTSRIKYVCDEEIIQMAPTIRIYTEENAHELATQFVKEGYEGAMVRLDRPYEFKRSSSLLKLKPWMDTYMLLVAVLEGAGKLKGHAGTLKVATPWGTYANVTPGGDFDRRKLIWETWKNNSKGLIGRPIHVKYQKRLPSGDLRHAVELLD